MAESARAEAPQLERLHPHAHAHHQAATGSNPFSPWDLASPDESGAGPPYTPYSWSSSPGAASSYFPAPRDKLLPTVPQIQVTQIVATIPHPVPPRPPAVLPPEAETTFEERVSDLPWASESDSRVEAGDVPDDVVREGEVGVDEQTIVLASMHKRNSDQ